MSGNLKHLYAPIYNKDNEKWNTLHKPNKVGVRSVNYKTLIKEMKGINKWKDKLHSWIGRFNIVKMSFLGEIPWQCSGSDSASQCRDCRFDHGQGTKIPHISWPKSQNRKQNNTVTKSIKSLKMVHLKKNFPKKKKRCQFFLNCSIGSMQKITEHLYTKKNSNSCFIQYFEN